MSPSRAAGSAALRGRYGEVGGFASSQHGADGAPPVLAACDVRPHSAQDGREPESTGILASSPSPE
eukprot:2679840-Alexandrium_andersonii.AAC.1